MKKKILSFMLLCLLAITMLGLNVSAGATETTEENNNEAAAQVMSSMNEVIYGSLKDYDQDYYQFNVSTGGVWNFKMTTTAELVNITIYKDNTDGTGGSIWSGNCYSDTSKGEINHNFYLLSGTYYVRVGNGKTNYSGESYTITTSYEHLSVSHYDKKNHSMANAITVSTGTTYNEIQEATFKLDYYKIVVNQPGTIRVNVKGFSFAQNKLFACNFWLSESESENRRLDFTVSADFTYYDDNTSSFSQPYFVEAGTYYLELGGGSGNMTALKDWGGRYSFSYTFEPVSGAKAEPNNEFVSASAIDLNTTVNGMIALNDDKDYYKFTVPSTGMLEIVFDEEMEATYPGSSGGGGRLALYDSNQNRIASCYRDTTFKYYLDKGDYYLNANQDGAYIGPYSFKTKFTPVDESLCEEDDTEAQANLVKIGKEYSGIVSQTDTWDYVKFNVSKEQELSVVLDYHTFGDGFYLFGANKSCSFYADSEEEEESGTKILDLGTVSPGTYTIQIYANHGYKGNLGGFKYSFKVVPTDSVDDSNTTGNSQGTVKSTKVVLNKTKRSVTQGKTYQLVAKVSPSDTTNKSIKWTSSNKKIATVDQNGKVTAKSVGTVKITAKTADTGKKATCTITVTPKTPKLTVKQKGKNVQLTWKKISGATGYKIYRSTKKKSGYKLVKTIKKNTIVKYTQKISSLKNKKTYYYKMVAYKKVGKKTYTSSYSSVKSVKIKK